MTDIRVWVDGALVDAGCPAVSAVDHGVTVGDGAFETVKIDGGVPFAVTRHLRRLDRTMAGLGLPAADHDRVREGIDAVLAGEPIEFGRLRFTVTGGRGPLGSDRARLRPHPHRHRRAARAPRAARRRRHGAVGAQRAGGDRRAEDHVVRRQRHRPGVREAARGRRGGVRQHPRRAVRGHRQQRLRRGRRRRAHPAAVERLPGRHHPRAGPRVVRARGARGRRGDPAARRADPADEVFLTSSIKDVFPVSAVDGSAAARPGTGDRAGRATCGPASAEKGMDP